MRVEAYKGKSKDLKARRVTNKLLVLILKNGDYFGKKCRSRERKDVQGTWKGIFLIFDFALTILLFFFFCDRVSLCSTDWS